MSASACLVTSTPELQAREQVGPFLLPSSADPDLRKVLRVIDDTKPVEFRANVLSEDLNDQAVKVTLLIDYGVRNEFSGTVFQDSAPANAPLAAGTLADGPRPISASFVPLQRMRDPGCHTVTMMVSHEFDLATGCPTEKKDSSQLVWFVFKCSDASCSNATCRDPEGCDVAPDDTCPPASPEVTCPDHVTPAGGTP